MTQITLSLDLDTYKKIGECLDRTIDNKSDFMNELIMDGFYHNTGEELGKGKYKIRFNLNIYVENMIKEQFPNADLSKIVRKLIASGLKVDNTTKSDLHLFMREFRLGGRIEGCKKVIEVLGQFRRCEI